MRGNVKVRELLLGALLASLAILIPTVFRIQLVLPPFSATLGSHVPTMLAMFISPAVAAMVGLGSTFGFFVTLGPIVAMRAAIHILIGVLGARLVRQGRTPASALVITALPHALGEALVVLPFGYTIFQAIVVVGLGTLFHHIIDSLIALVINGSLDKAGLRLTEMIPTKANIK